MVSKAKIRATRFYLSCKGFDYRELYSCFANMRYFRTKYAQEVFDNPFLTGERHIYVLNKIAEWADIKLVKNWEWYATPEFAKQLQQSILHRPYVEVGPGDIDPRLYDVYFQEAKVKYLKKLSEAAQNKS